MSNTCNCYRRQAWWLLLMLVGLYATIHWQPRWLESADDQPAVKGLSRRLVAAGVFLTMMLLVIQSLWRPLFLNTVIVKNWLLSCVVLTGVVMVFLLPPFQGPDEMAHWKMAISLNRANFAAEPCLLNLPETLNVYGIPFHTEKKLTRRNFALSLY